MTEKKNIGFISFLQVIGPIMVVLGHSLNGLSVSHSNPWYIFSKDWIYYFHMPLFFMISGYLLAVKSWMGNKSYWQFVKSKFLRLMVPYLVWNIAFCIPKIFLNEFLGDAPVDFWSMVKAFVFPRENIWGHTWYLMAAFIIYLMTPFWKKLFTSGKAVAICAIVVGVVLYGLPINTFFLCLNDLHRDLLFFFMGCFLGSNVTEEFFNRMFKGKKVFVYAGIMVAVSAVFLFLVDKDAIYLQFIPCFVILWTLISIGVNVNCNNVVLYLSKNSFAIYIMHWPIMIGVRIVLHQTLNLPIAVTAVAMSVLGYAIPLVVVFVVRKIKQRHISTACKYLLGA